MKIKRIINDKIVEIELTSTELHEAYFEQEHYYDMEDVKSALEEAGCEFTENQISEAAYLARKWMDGNDVIADCRWNCIDEAIEEVS